MAYFSQENKKKVAPVIKAVLKKYGVKGTLSVRNHSTLEVNLKEGALDFLSFYQKASDARNERDNRQKYKIDYVQVNQYYDAERAREFGYSKIADFLTELVRAMKSGGWYDNSDIQSDYFDTAYYLSINIGKWDKGYKFVR